MRYAPALALALLALLLFFGAPTRTPTASAEEPERVALAKIWIRVDDGDSFHIDWPKKEKPETVRILGIDAPEVQHLEHDIPYDQAFGPEARGFLRGCLASADRVELVRAKTKDPYGRTLGYVFFDGWNYSVLAIQARLAVETVGHYGDNGLPKLAGQVQAAAARAGPAPFEAPYRYRRRMREVAKWMKEKGVYPAAAASGSK
ncbi:MAG: thermonuclease family protein [Planctomycetota bacterium]|nr:thermonuclease family protein [Planctomycetota bacterium]